MNEKKKKETKKQRPPISLEDLVPRTDVRGSGQQQIFGILSRDNKPKQTKDN